MKISDGESTVFTDRAEAEELAAVNQVADRDWAYKVASRVGGFVVLVFDENDCFVGRL